MKALSEAAKKMTWSLVSIYWYLSFNLLHNDKKWNKRVYINLSY